jgi:hypothetical protein
VLGGLPVNTSAHDPVWLAGAAALTLCAGGIGCLLAAQGAARTLVRRTPSATEQNTPSAPSCAINYATDSVSITPQ